ncbi:hypothetical protein DXC78_09365 [Faecalicoccus pleomorphus]|uniref:Uncharacterized protein n=1 Tax=Faecalicoccus pleomorphus TaxID=1323 RepID=A0A3E3E0I2_9FIRM|nr:hypothetical protein [Faecalicoccus pleomorphus]RGD74836.1 hypothetical protein DXC78_09365 [Faecalicoccus pleomorphus]
MNIQINANDKVTKNELMYIYHNLESIKRKYKESWKYKSQQDFDKKYTWQKPPQWKYELSGIGGIGARVGRKVIIKGTNGTLYFSFKELKENERNCVWI